MKAHVKNWPAYLLNNIPPTTTQGLIQEAVDRDLSVNDVIRQALCKRYGLDCEPESMTHVAGLYKGGSILIRLQPELYKAIKKETRNQYGAVRALILDTLADYLEAQ
jgi:hypothetical protein